MSATVKSRHPLTGCSGAFLGLIIFVASMLYSAILLLWLVIGWPIVYDQQLLEVIPEFREDTILVFEEIDQPEDISIVQAPEYNNLPQLYTTIGYRIDMTYTTSLGFDDVSNHYISTMEQDSWELVEFRKSSYVYPTAGNGFIGYVLFVKDSACSEIHIYSHQETSVFMRVWLDVDEQPYSPWRPPRIILTAIRLSLVPYEVLTCP